jgi:hypothetical protein
MRALPTELWLIIFDLVIEEGIIRVDQCDYTKFPYIQPILSNVPLRYRSYDSYRRLRLVCRSFKAILGDPPSQTLSASSIFTLSTTIRVLILDFNWLRTNFQLLAAQTLSCRRIIYIDVTCDVTPSSDGPTLFDFLRASAGRAFHNVQRLILRLESDLQFTLYVERFWIRLHEAFPWLVTLVITHENTEYGYVVLDAADRVTSFEYLEILYLGRSIGYAGCRFPHLRHASISGCAPDEMEILTNSPHLESLLIRSFHNSAISMGSCSRLKLLGVHVAECNSVIPPEDDHPLEHLWVFIPDGIGDYRSITELVTLLPRISRVTIDLSSIIDEQWRSRITQRLQGIGFASVGMDMRPAVHGASHLVIERSPASIGV